MGKQDARIWGRNANDQASAAINQAEIDFLDELEETTQLEAIDGAPYLRPRPAAALVLFDLSGGTPRVLMGRRNSNLEFMADIFVFPGGRVDPLDRLMPHVGSLPTDAQRALTFGGRTVGSARALALAAIRETYEETGQLLGVPAPAPFTAPEGIWRDFSHFGVLPNLDGLRLIARAVTPTRQIRRYDTSFFAADASEIATAKPAEASEHDELLEVSWLTLDEIQSRPLAVITRVVLFEFAKRLKEGLDAPCSIPYYRRLQGRWRRQSL